MAFEGRGSMGIYLNPTNEKFGMALHSKIYVDKTELIAYTNSVIRTEQRFVCVSRPRRFGKSMAANMLTAYYSSGCDSKELFQGLKIADDPEFGKYLNKYLVISLNIQEFLSETSCVEEMLALLCESVLWELLDKYPNLRYFNKNNLVRTMRDIYGTVKIPFIIIIDEWDCVFREYKTDAEAQSRYLDFLRDLLKDKEFVHLTYMTGILPIKKYGTHSALNMFAEFSMTNPKQMAEFVGFTDSEVKRLCDDYEMSYEEIKAWYDGYSFDRGVSVYSPKSVVECVASRIYDNYWNQTETFEALKVYIQMNYDGLKDNVTRMMAGARVKISTGSFTNDMATFHNADDVLTLLIHLGYLAYDFAEKEVYIPNREVSDEFINAVGVIGWTEIIDSIKESDRLLAALWRLDEEAITFAIEKVHQNNTSILQYNDENALSYTVNLAFYAAREYYTIIRELPTGKGFADLVFIPRKRFPDKPALVIELKWDKNVKGAINQIKNKEYSDALKEYKGNIILAGISYDKETKKHNCKAELWCK